MSPHAFASSLVVIFAMIGLVLLFEVPLLGLAILVLTGGIAYRFTKD